MFNLKNRIKAGPRDRITAAMTSALIGNLLKARAASYIRQKSAQTAENL
jgi:hypothetical protein